MGLGAVEQRVADGQRGGAGDTDSLVCGRKGPTVLEVYVDPEEAPPLGMV